MNGNNRLVLFDLPLQQHRLVAQKLLTDNLADLACTDHLMDSFKSCPLNAIGLTGLQHSNDLAAFHKHRTTGQVNAGGNDMGVRDECLHIRSMMLCC